MNSEKYIGLDVHQATISVAVMDSTGQGRHGIHPGNESRNHFWSSLRDCAELCR